MKRAKNRPSIDTSYDEDDIIAASDAGDAKAVRKRLAEDPTTVNETSSIGMTPLHAAAGQNQTKICRILLDNGANIAARCDRGRTPLHYAAEVGAVDIAKLLLERGADVAAQGDRGETPLDLAYGHEEVGRSETSKMVRFLKQRHDPGDMRKFSAAITRGKVKEVRLILKKDPAIVSKFGDPGELLRMAVFHETEAGSTEIIRLLLEAGIRPTTKSKFWPEPTIFYAHTPELAELLLAAGANPNVKNMHGMTPLQKARQFELKELEAVLLKYGATFEAKPLRASKRAARPTAKPAQAKPRARKKKRAE